MPPLEDHTAPLVSCIMPTYNRRAFVPHAIRYFLRQQYKHKELIILDDGEDKVQDLIPDTPFIRYYPLPAKITLGAKLNFACNYAKGDIIANWDDDDWYADWRLQYQVDQLLNDQKEVCGINRLLYFNITNQSAYQYIYPPSERVWLLGSSLCFKKELWRKNHFASIDVGMDGLFVWNTPPERVAVLDNYHFSVHMIHESNVSPKKTDHAWWHPLGTGDLQEIMCEDWQYYAGGKVICPPERAVFTTPANILPGEKRHKNVFACLVHEQPDCIEDLVKNLHHHDPASGIVLYNGSTNKDLIPKNLDFEQYRIMIVPAPRPLKHGYLHEFAFKSFQIALDYFDADTVTIVDSDQLCIRKDYTNYIKTFLAQRSNIGVLSSDCRRFDAKDSTNYVAGQAFREYELWKPLLRQFQGGEDCFVYWTFWPSSVFTKNAMRDLLELVNTNETLQSILQRTDIWATEEVILPTLIKLLGYEICNNPCSYELVRYKQPISEEEVEKAVLKPNVYWVHPISRSANDSLRRLIRTKCHGHEKEKQRYGNNFKVDGCAFDVDPFIQSIQHINGWLSTGEAKMLARSCLESLSGCVDAKIVVEVGAFHGKSTVLLGLAIQKFFPEVTLYSIDPHDGKQGARDQGLKKYGASFGYFQSNIASAGLEDQIEVIRAYTGNIVWDKAVSFLWVDGLHDYESVSGDFHRFEKWLAPNAWIAFHDYAAYFPGVIKFVDQLIATNYIKVAAEESLIILRRR